ncbi:hypothetical protein Trydic_g16467 [Trypoxylus dichotomus]
MDTDALRPSTSTVKPSYAAAVKKPKASGKPKTPAATNGPNPAPKKPETPKSGKPAKPVIAKNPARDVPRTTTARTERDASSTLALLIPLFQRINWTKLQEVHTSTTTPGVQIRSRAGLVLASHLQDILAVFISYE